MSSTTPKQPRKSTGIKVAAGVTVGAVLAIVGYFYQPTGIQAFYDNDLKNHIETNEVRAAQIAWLEKNHCNALDIYGADSYIGTTAHDNNMAAYLDSLEAHGIKSKGFVYSSTSAISKLRNFQNKYRMQSRFTRVVMEEEPYNTGNYAKFYADLQAWDKFLDSMKMEHDIYVGWETQAAFDSMVVHGCRIYIHAYGKYDTYSNVGAWIYGYCKTRFNMIADTHRRFPLLPKTNEITLLSCENPDPSKTQFGYKYFTTHDWWTPQGSFLTYWTLNASSALKAAFINGGSMIFVTQQAKQIKP